ncbi:MAG: DUF438 domain-containing protein [Candidatus Cloacimonadota bacterium]|nr:MAG: DUF438 domain-containing protein [Candidatus Cloacimonadota bacterium]
MEINEALKMKIKELMKMLHAGESPEKVKERFKDALKETTPEMISKVEEELIKEGMKRDEIRKLCDIHLAIFKESLEKVKLDVAIGHPIYIFMEEHKILLKTLDELKDIWAKIKSQEDLKSDSDKWNKLRHIAAAFMEAEKHNVREENVLFPYLEKKGVTEPPKVMWAEHNELKERKRRFLEIVNSYKSKDYARFVKELDEIINYIIVTLGSHIYKEDNILYPTAIRLINGDEWKDIKKECDELGYCCFTPEDIIKKEEGEDKKVEGKVEDGKIVFETGTVSKDELEAILDTIPFDISFVGDEDTVRYFNKSEERIFPRTKAVIGRTVQQCHPEKSLHLVNQIIDDFRQGKKDVAEFWITVNERLIHIRYFPVKDKDGKYLGTMEVSQDITDIKKIEGEKRLL